MNFFQTKGKGEVFELKRDLNSNFSEKRKETLKRVIQNMTIGKDSSSLFPDVVKLMHTEDLELKKLVYLYLMNYAKTQPELVILVVNTFVSDSSHPNPMVRALAIRTMGCLKVVKIFDYLMEPLKKAIEDEDPYVRKTACLAVLKLFDLNPTLAIENGLLTSLQELLSDRNPMVISNAVAALAEIQQQIPDIFIINDFILQKLLAALNDSTEWGQGFILNSLAQHRPPSSQVAAEICERVFPRLQHVNSSVSLAAVKVLINYIQYGLPAELEESILRKLAPPLVTLLSTEPEIQFVVLRNISLILQKEPRILSDQVNVFFTKYNDPPYVKLEKLEIIVKLTNENNCDKVIGELKEYCNEVDATFVRSSIKAIAKCAIKLPSKADRCVAALMDLLSLGVEFVVQETIVVMKDIFRKYPQKYEAVIPTLCKNMETLDEMESRAALIWIVGEYAEIIDNSTQILEYFYESFIYEAVSVQMQLITAAVKLMLKRPGGQELCKNVLLNATEKNENPDIRDRATIYLRLLSKGPELSKNVVLTEVPPIELSPDITDELLQTLLMNIGSLASVLHKPPVLVEDATKMDINLENINLYADETVDKSVFVETAQAMGTGDLIENLLDLDLAPTEPNSGNSQQPPASAITNIMDLMSLDVGLNNMSVSTPNMECFLQSESAGGMELLGGFVGNPLTLMLKINNKSPAPLSEIAIQFNVNSYGIVPEPFTFPSIPIGGTFEAAIKLNTGGTVKEMNPINMLQVAIKNNVGVYYFATLIPEELI